MSRIHSRHSGAFVNWGRDEYEKKFIKKDKNNEKQENRKTIYGD
jgi:hypothetical protein